MFTKTYGKTGIKVSAVGFGGMRFDLTRPLEENGEMLPYAFERGITYFDTAPGYCDDKSEEIFGLGLRQLAKVRDKIFISTKAMPTAEDTVESVRQAVEKSLEKLGTDYIDFYHIWCLRKPEHWRLACRPGGELEGLRKCQEAGLIRQIVCSSHMSGPDIRRVLEEGQVAGVLLGMNILNFPYRWEAVAGAYEMGLGVVAMNPLLGGAIAKHAERLSFLAGPGETPVEAALRFCISCPQITVTLNGFSTREQIDQACRVAQNARPFSAADLEALRRRLSANMDSLCTGCGYCLKDCPAGIPIASYMLYYNNKLLFNQTEEELAKYIGPEKEWGLLGTRQADAGACTSCGRCEEACTQHLAIIDRLAEVARWEEKNQSLSK